MSPKTRVACVAPQMVKKTLKSQFLPTLFAFLSEKSGTSQAKTQKSVGISALKKTAITAGSRFSKRPVDNSEGV